MHITKLWYVIHCAYFLQNRFSEELSLMYLWQEDYDRARHYNRMAIDFFLQVEHTYGYCSETYANRPFCKHEFCLPTFRNCYRIHIERMFISVFLARVFLEKTLSIAIALVASSASCKNFDILEYLCYYWRYLLETWRMCLLAIEQSILSRETIQNAYFSELCSFFK